MTSDQAEQLRALRMKQIDYLNQKMITLAEKNGQLYAVREKHALDQFMQLELDRAQAQLDTFRKRYLRLKEEAARLDIPE